MWPRNLPFTVSNTSIRFFRHALSLDERRAKFKPNYYHLQHAKNQKGTKPGDMPGSNQAFHRNKHHHHFGKEKVLPDEKNDDGPPEARVREVWFAGCHAGNSHCLNVIYLVLTSFCRHWWGISREWHSEQLGKNPTSLDDSSMFSY
jgi:hypothetical protein